jgi:hypothetical protein
MKTYSLSGKGAFVEKPLDESKPCMISFIYMRKAFSGNPCRMKMLADESGLCLQAA